MDQLRSDASQLRKIGSDLRKAQPALVGAVRRAQLAQGKLIAAAAADKASWSKRIPASISVHTQGLLTVVIRAGGESAPHAAPYEHDGKNTSFRHPLNYPNQGQRQHWVSQQSRPFLHPSVEDKLDEVRRAIVEAAVATIQSKLL